MKLVSPTTIGAAKSAKAPMNTRRAPVIKPGMVNGIVTSKRRLKPTDPTLSAASSSEASILLSESRTFSVMNGNK